LAPIRLFETNDAGVQQGVLMMRLPSFLRRLYIWYMRYIKRDEIYAGLLDGLHVKSAKELWPIVAEKEDYKLKWFEYWQDKKLDFILTVPNALPAVPHNGMKEGFGACGYTFLWNVVSKSALLCLRRYLSISSTSYSLIILLAYFLSLTLTALWTGLTGRPSSLATVSSVISAGCMTPTPCMDSL